MGKMMDKRFLLLSTLVCLLPIAFYLFVYDQLPEQMAMQWNLEGQVNWYAPKLTAVLSLPLSLAAIHLATLFLRRFDPKRENTSAAMQTILDWLIPVLSILINTYSILQNTGADIPTAVPLILVGIILIIIGNYLPKSRQNYTVGIRIPWTLHDADNWNKTHRLAGPLVMLGGVAMIIAALTPFKSLLWLILILAVVVLIVAVPCLYSFSLHLKKLSPKPENDR